MSTRRIGFAAFIAAGTLAAGQAQATSSNSLTIAHARQLLKRHGFQADAWNRHIGPCKRRVQFPRGFPPLTVVRCQLSQNAVKLSHGHLFVGTIVQNGLVQVGGAFVQGFHIQLGKERDTPLPLHFSVTIDPNIPQASGYDANGNWWSADYTYRAAASAGTINLVAVRHLPNGWLRLSAPGGSFAGGETTCSYRVGSGVSTQLCSMVYRSTGTYQVTAQYAPDGAPPVSVTESVNIG